MRSCATRSTNLKGPAHTGLAPNLSPSACAAFGDTIMPARSASCASSGENGADRLSRTVIGSTTSTLCTGASSPRRLEPGIVLWRSRLYFTAAASIFSPSWNVTPLRRWSVSALLSADHSYDVASCGTMFSLSSMSNSLSHIAAKTMRPTNVRARVGSRTSGSSASPMRRVCALTPAPSASQTSPMTNRRSMRTSSEARSVDFRRVRRARIARRRRAPRGSGLGDEARRLLHVGRAVDVHRRAHLHQRNDRGRAGDDAEPDSRRGARDRLAELRLDGGIRHRALDVDGAAQGEDAAVLRLRHEAQ